jgi:hypothetical protein
MIPKDSRCASRQEKKQNAAVSPFQDWCGSIVFSFSGDCLLLGQCHQE